MEMVYLFWWFTMIYLWKMVIFTANYQITRWQTMEKPRIVDRFPGKIDGWWMVMVDRPEEPKLIHPDWSNIGNSKQNWWVENPLETSWNQMKGLVFLANNLNPPFPNLMGINSLCLPETSQTHVQKWSFELPWNVCEPIIYFASSVSKLDTWSG